MSLVASLILRVLHFCYSLFLLLSNYWNNSIRLTPQPLTAKRNRLPKHLAVALVTNQKVSDVLTEQMIEAVGRVVNWCRHVGIGKLTVYDEFGILLEHSEGVRSQITQPTEPVADPSSDSELEYPLTPPPSDYSESRPLSPEDGACYQNNVVTFHVPERLRPHKPLKRRNVARRRRAKLCDTPSDTTSTAAAAPLTLCIASRASSKPAIAAAASSLAFRLRSSKISKPQNRAGVSIDRLDALLEGDNGLSDPDFMIVQSVTDMTLSESNCLELHGFPPWQIRLTEIFQIKTFEAGRNTATTPLIDELSFREALDEFGSAEMRFGK